MFQTFSGSSRRPRQVNLSGQNANPFAAFNPSGSGTQKTVANAQQQRQQRQQERDRLNASKRIQRVWRGHKTRRELADARRQIWDSNSAAVAQLSPDITAAQLQHLLLFFSARNRDDIKRLRSMSQAISDVGFGKFLAFPGIQSRLVRLASISLEALQVSLPEIHPIFLQLLVATIKQNPKVFPPISQAYYTFLSNFLCLSSSKKVNVGGKSYIFEAIKSPLMEHISLENQDEISLNSYAAFAFNLLTTPDLATLLGPPSSKSLADVVNVGILSSALVRGYSSQSVHHIEPERQLWLLAHFIHIHRLQHRSSDNPAFLRALSLQLSASSAAIISRIDSAEILLDFTESSKEVKGLPLPLPAFIKNELLSLVSKESINGLLSKFNTDHLKSLGTGDDDASLLASYALTLLRIFPRKADETRMFLYRGSLKISAGVQVPALKFFWQAMSASSIFSTIGADSKAALALLRTQVRQSQASSDHQDREWRTILLFLELYTFVLRFTDDEEFLSGSKALLGQSNESLTRIQESALPLEDVKQLTVFLKNLAFTTYYNGGELSDDGHSSAGGLGTYFGGTAHPRFQAIEASDATKSTIQPFAGIAGMTFSYVRTIVTGVMRMLYERDSRRRFLPKNHWLMTSRFDMEGFIPAVVSEEERQQEVREEGEEEEPEDDLLSSNANLGLVGMARARRAVEIEGLRRQQQKAARQKLLAAVGPRLEVLQNMPFTIPFDTRVQIFRQFVLRDQMRRRGGNVDPDVWRMAVLQQAQAARGSDPRAGHEMLGKHHARIRRDQLFDNAYEQFYELGEGLKEPIQISFVDQFGSVEAGIDGGGVTKEFLTSITNAAFGSEQTDDLTRMFVTNDQNLLYPNPAALDERRELLREAGLKDTEAAWKENIADLLQRYEFLGRVVGKCLYEGILVDISFAGFFLLKWAAAASESGYKPNINDLRDLDESLYQGLLKLKNYPGDVEDFSVNFTITDTISIPGEPTKTIERDLIPNGSNIAVTNENRPTYLFCVVGHRLVAQPKLQTQAFLKGLSDIINPSWLSMFNQSEIQTLIGGDSSEIDVEDLRRNTLYGGVYQIGDDGEEHDTIKYFWKVMKELDDADRRKVLKYVTSTPRAPLLGFSQLNPRFSIRDSSDDQQRLPSTSTCVNLLKLPRYASYGLLKSKLLYAINSNAGFDLS